MNKILFWIIIILVIISCNNDDCNPETNDLSSSKIVDAELFYIKGGGFGENQCGHMLFYTNDNFETLNRCKLMHVPTGFDANQGAKLEFRGKLEIFSATIECYDTSYEPAPGENVIPFNLELVRILEWQEL